MKKRTLISIAILFIAGALYFNLNSSPIISGEPVNMEQELAKDGVIFRNDLKEAILEFADEDTPADSLYMPEFLR